MITVLTMMLIVMVRIGSFGLCLAFSVLSYPQARILELIGLVQHRELTASLLDLNDQMNNQLLRFFSPHHHDISKNITSGLSVTRTTLQRSAEQ